MSGFQTEAMRRLGLIKDDNHRIHELENALNGMLGLVTLICDRPDMPLLLREAIITSHRTREARRVMATTLTDRPAPRDPNSSPALET